MCAKQGICWSISKLKYQLCCRFDGVAVYQDGLVKQLFDLTNEDLTNCSRC